MATSKKSAKRKKPAAKKVTPGSISVQLTRLSKAVKKLTVPKKPAKKKK